MEAGVLCPFRKALVLAEGAPEPKDEHHPQSYTRNDAGNAEAPNKTRLVILQRTVLRQVEDEGQPGEKGDKSQSRAKGGGPLSLGVIALAVNYYQQPDAGNDGERKVDQVVQVALHTLS